MDNEAFNKKTVYIPFDLLSDTKYEHVLLVDGEKECYYDVDNGNLYEKVMIKSSPLLIDYSSNKTKKMFDAAAQKEDWNTLYEHTKFLIDLGDTSAWFSFQFIPYDQKYLETPFAIITAFNPNMKSKDRTPEENRTANTELSLILEEGKYHFLLSEGELSGYSEDSYIVYDIALDDALELGRVFRQKSIVFNNGKILAIVECKTSAKIIEVNHYKIYDKLQKVFK